MLHRSLIAALAALALSASFASAQSNCRVSTSAPTYVDGQVSPLSCDTSGGVRTSSSGGGGGAVTIADGADVTQGAIADAAATQGGTGTISAKLRLMTSQLNTISGLLAGTITVSGSVTVSGTVTANQGGAPWSFNQTQINGTTLLAGNGATGTGSPRVTLSNDTSAIAGWGLGATGSAAPSGAQQTGVRSGANMVAMTQANASAAISVTTATTTQLVALSASAVIHVTSFDVIAAGTGNIKFVYGTGSSCGTGTTDLTGNYNLTAQAGIAKGSGIGPVLVVPAGNALCVTTSAAVGMYGSVSYTQFVP